MSAIKFHIGDKVVLKPNLVASAAYGGYSYIDAMHFIGYRTVIKCFINGYILSGTSYLYSDEMLLPYGESKGYKVGDYVELKSCLIDNNRYGNDIFISCMRFSGIRRIKKATEFCTETKYTLEGMGNWYYTAEMLTPASTPTDNNEGKVTPSGSSSIVESPPIDIISSIVLHRKKKIKFNFS